MEARTQKMDTPPPLPAGATQQMNRTIATGPPGFDPMKTAMGAPMRAMELEVVPGSRYGYAPSSSRKHLMLLLKSSSQMIGRRMPLNLCLVIDRSGSMEGE